jgi:hypothetical protein
MWSWNCLLPPNFSVLLRQAAAAGARPGPLEAARGGSRGPRCRIGDARERAEYIARTAAYRAYGGISRVWRHIARMAAYRAYCGISRVWWQRRPAMQGRRPAVGSACAPPPACTRAHRLRRRPMFTRAGAFRGTIAGGYEDRWSPVIGVRVCGWTSASSVAPCGMPPPRACSTRLPPRSSPACCERMPQARAPLAADVHARGRIAWHRLTQSPVL